MGNKQQMVKQLFELSEILAEVIEELPQANHQTDSVKTSVTEQQTPGHTPLGLEAQLSGDGSAG